MTSATNQPNWIRDDLPVEVSIFTREKSGSVIWHSRYYPNLEAAREVFPPLDPHNGSKYFSPARPTTIQGQPGMPFDKKGSGK